jgi:hypothetical protein
LTGVIQVERFSSLRPIGGIAIAARFEFADEQISSISRGSRSLLIWASGWRYQTCESEMALTNSECDTTLVIMLRISTICIFDMGC